MSTDDIGLRDMMVSLQVLGKMPDIHLFVVSIESLQQQGVELTVPVRQVLPLLVGQVIELIRELDRNAVA